MQPAAYDWSVQYYPLTPAYRLDPYPDLHRLRTGDPVHWSQHGQCWVLTRYHDIRFVLSDRRFAIALEWMMQMPGLAPTFAEPYNQIIKTQILAADPPAHPRIRSVMSKRFLPSHLEEMRSLIQRAADECIDDAIAAGSLDLIAGFAHRLPFTVVSELMGIPIEEREPLATCTHDLMRSTDPNPMDHRELERCNRAAIGFRDYFLALARRRRVHPTDDVFGDMLAACDAGAISEEEMIANFILFFCAGHDTVVNLFGNGMLALHRNPEQLRLLQENPALIRNSIEELLRYDTSVQIARRTALEPVEIGGRWISPGHYVLCSLGGGNRDPSVFPDPDRLDVTRQNVRPLSFGGGIHHCLGAQLARLEGEIGFSTLFARLPNLRLVTLDPPWKQNVFIRGVERLDATF